MKWINNIYLITNNQFPDYLKINHYKLFVINVDNLFSEYNTTSYNTFAIQSL